MTKLETPPLGSAPFSSLRFDFGSGTDSAQSVTAKTRFSEELGYGWVGFGDRRNVTRTNSDDPFRSRFILGRDTSIFRVALPAGRYRGVMYLGDVKGVRRCARVRVTGGGSPMSVTTEYHNLGELVFVARSSGNAIDFVIENAGGTEDGWALIGLDLDAIGSVPGVQASRTDKASLSESDDLWNLPTETEAGARGMLRTWRAGIGSQGAPDPTGKSARDYLSRISGCVDYFAPLQDSAGAIIDPHRGAEFQYATPCFAYSAALVARDYGRADLIEPAFAAFRFAAAALGERTAADGHEDFYPSPLAHAYALLGTLVPEDRLLAAAEPLRGYDAFKTFRKRPGGTKRSGANWNCKALAGQWLMIKTGLQADNGYVAKSLQRQGQWFDNEYGLYAEGPATYDAFPRAWMADMLAQGYDGTHKDQLTEALDRAAITALFMQSPTGELATGGRSSHHQWSDAIQCTTFEWAASRALAAGDRDLAGTFKRAARRALAALDPWVRPSGEFWIVKNRAEPAERHGYEVYSSHSQYNLLTCTALGFAYEMAGATEDVHEAPTPAEHGRSTLVTGAGIGRAFVNSQGTQVEIALDPVPLQTPRGILRVHMAGLPSQIPLTDGSPDAPMFNLPETSAPAIAMGLAWADPEGTTLAQSGTLLRSMAGLKAAEMHSEVLRHGATARGAYLIHKHRLLTGAGPRNISEAIDVEPGAATMTWTWSPNWEGPVLLRFPIFVSDGETSAEVLAEDDGSAVTVVWKGAQARFERVGDGAPLVLSAQHWPFRCGWFRVAELAAVKPSLTLRVSGATI